MSDIPPPPEDDIFDALIEEAKEEAKELADDAVDKAADVAESWFRKLLKKWFSKKKK